VKLLEKEAGGLRVVATYKCLTSQKCDKRKQSKGSSIIPVISVG
jgi:hypothetical protein